MAIQENPELDNEINNQSHGGDGFHRPKYCRKCGQTMIYSKQDKSGDVDPTFEWRWKHSVCSKCYREHYR